MAETKEDWDGSFFYRDNDILLDTDGAAEFHKVWSVLEFVSCVSETSTQKVDLPVLGDGFLWCGAAYFYSFIHKLLSVDFYFLD